MNKHNGTLETINTRELQTVAGKQINPKVARNVYELQRSIVARCVKAHGRDRISPQKAARDYGISEDLVMAMVCAYYNDLLGERESHRGMATVYAR